jgi:hypothetical protein
MTLSLHPDHIADLEKSGLSKETILLAEIETVRPDRINKELGFNLPGLTSMYKIPYNDKFARFRCFYDDGKTGAKYLQKKGTRNYLYFPPNLDRSILQAVDVPLYFTEGEKKSLRACQEGIPCVGLSGLWNWQDKKGNLIPNFDSIKLQNRIIRLVPDDDWQTPNKHGYGKNLKQAVYRLAGKLKERGARVFIVDLAGGNNGR